MNTARASLTNDVNLSTSVPFECAYQLGQFIKCISKSFSRIRACATNDEETYLMLAALNAIGLKLLTLKRSGEGRTTADVTIALTLPFESAYQLAQFIKRVSWSEIRQCATTDDDTYMILGSLNAIARDMADDHGIAPR